MRIIQKPFRTLPLVLSRSWHALPRRSKLLGLLAVFALLLLLAGLALRDRGLAPARLVSNSTAERVAVGARGPITLAFAEPMLPGSVESHLFFDPPVAGSFIWEGSTDQTVSFWPERLLQPGQRFIVRLEAGARSRNQKIVRLAQTWEVEVRQPALLFLSPSQAPELWIVSSGGQSRAQLTHSNGKIIDYGVSYDGNHIAYAVKNEQQGIDLWEMDRQGGAAVLLLPCGADWCADPAYAPDGNTIVYSRRRVSGIPGRQPEMPRIWTVDRAALTTAELFADPHISATRTYWSPDGRYLAFYDDTSAGVRIYDAETGSHSLFPAAQGTGIEWAPDGASMLYLVAGMRGELPYSTVTQLDVRTQETRQVLGESAGAADYSVPARSSDGVWMAFGQRLDGGSLTRQLWLARFGEKNASERQPITADVLFTHGGYQWEPGGSRLVFQRLAYGRSDSLPDIAVWNRQDGHTLLLAEDAFQPLWIP